MFSTKRLTQKEKELIAIAASIASGCVPCTRRYINAAREIGASEREILRSTIIASDVRDNATEIMAEAALGNSINLYPTRIQSNPTEQPIDDLISMGAALACNSAAGLEHYVTKAKTEGASPHQIQTAIGIARAIRKAAEREADIIVGNLVEPTHVMSGIEAGGAYEQAESDQSKHMNDDVTTNKEEPQASNPPPCSCS